jgi:signal transduction histidine kinase
MSERRIAGIASWWVTPRAPLVLLPLGVAVGVLAELSLANAGVGLDGIVTDAASGYSFLLAGLAAWYRRPRNRSGPLMAGIGLAWFGGDFLFAPVPLVGPASFGAQAAARVLFAWLLLAFPSGHLESAVHRLAVATIAVLASGLALVQLVTIDPASLCACPSSPFAVATEAPIAEQAGNMASAVGILMTLILVPLVIRRVAIASGPLRRTLLPVLAGGVFSLLSVLPDILVHLGDTQAEPISWLPIVYVALPLGFLVALLRERMARGAVADLVIEMGSTPQPRNLRDALAQALGDPSLELLAWSADDGSFVTADGTPTALPASTRDTAVSMLEGDRGTIGAIVHDPHLLDDPGLVASVIAAARLAVENEQLHAEVEAQLAEVQESRARLVHAGDVERRRLERDLHDGAQQRLVALSLALRRTRGRYTNEGDAELAANLDEASLMVRDALAELRELARGIHPAVLTEAGLDGAIASLVAASPATVTVEGTLDRRLDADVEAAAYFFVSEALANIAKHAPGARASVRASVTDGALELEVADDGPGGARADGGTGLLGLRDRIAVAGGRFELESPPGRGTRVRARIPVTDADRAEP